MDTDQNWYQQLLALILLSISKAGVEFLTDPGSRSNATDQLKGAFQNIDYDALATALTTAIDTLASESKGKLNEAIDQLRDKGVDAVEDAKERAEKQLGQKRGGGKMKFFLSVVIGGLLTYFLLNEQRRDNLMDKLTGASGPVQQPRNTATQAVTEAENVANQAMQGNPNQQGQ